MEVKDVIYLVLGSNFIIALATFFATYLTTKMQIKNSDKRFEKELEKTREEEKRNRRWEVGSEPLLQLREELAVMAAKQEILVYDLLSSSIVNSKEMKLGENQAYKDWTNHLQDYQRIIYLQNNEEIINLVQEIFGNYQKAQIKILGDETPDKVLKQALLSSEKNSKKIVEVQKLINKKLEEF